MKKLLLLFLLFVGIAQSQTRFYFYEGTTGTTTDTISFTTPVTSVLVQFKETDADTLTIWTKGSSPPTAEKIKLVGQGKYILSFTGATTISKLFLLASDSSKKRIILASTNGSLDMFHGSDLIKLDSLITELTAIRYAVDQIEGYTDGLENLGDTSNARIGRIEDVLQDTINVKATVSNDSLKVFYSSVQHSIVDNDSLKMYNSILNDIFTKLADSIKVYFGSVQHSVIDNDSLKTYFSHVIHTIIDNDSLKTYFGSAPAVIVTFPDSQKVYNGTVQHSIIDNASIPVTGTFWQATQPVSGTFWQATQPVSGTVTANVTFPDSQKIFNNTFLDDIITRLNTLNNSVSTAVRQDTFNARIDVIRYAVDQLEGYVDGLEAKTDTAIARMLRLEDGNYKTIKLFAFTSATSNTIDTVSRKHTANYLNTLKDTVFSKFYRISVTADSTIEISNSSSFPSNATIVVRAGYSFTSKDWNVTTYPNLYYRKKSTAAGNTQVDFIFEGY